jgi:hypothetical protein
MFGKNKEKGTKICLDDDLFSSNAKEQYMSFIKGALGCLANPCDDCQHHPATVWLLTIPTYPSQIWLTDSASNQSHAIASLVHTLGMFGTA